MSNNKTDSILDKEKGKVLDDTFVEGSNMSVISDSEDDKIDAAYKKAHAASGKSIGDPTDEEIDAAYEKAKLKGDRTALRSHSSANSILFGHDSPFGKSKYDEGLNPIHDLDFNNLYSDLEYYRGEKQSAGRKAVYGIGRVLSKAATEILKMPGFVYGLGEAIVGAGLDKISGEDNHNFIESITSNAWIDGFEKLDESIKELLPVYATEDSQKNLWQAATSLSFWAKDGADGIGFIISMLAPGVATKLLGLGSKTMRLIGWGGRLASRGAKGGKALLKLEEGISAIEKASETSKILGQVGKIAQTSEEGLSLLGKTLPKSLVNAKTIDLLTATALSTSFESAEEARGLMKELRTKLEAEGNLTDEQITKIVSERGRASFFANIAILAIPNFFANKMLLGRFKGTSFGVGARKAAADLTTKEAIWRGLKTGVFAGFREGFYEEGLQSTTENYLLDPEKYKNADGNIDIFSAYSTMLGTLDGQKAILLGSVFGAIMGGAERYGAAKTEASQEVAVEKILKNVFKSFTSNLVDSYKRDENGKIVYEKDGITPVKDLIKIRENLKSFVDGVTMSTLLDEAINKNDKIAYALLSNTAFTSVLSPYIQIEGGLERLREQLEGNKDLLNQQNKTFEGENLTTDGYINKLMEVAKKYKSNFELYNNYRNPSLNLESVASPEVVSAYGTELANSYAYYKSYENALDRGINELQADLHRIKELNNSTDAKEKIGIKDAISSGVSGIENEINKRIEELSKFKIKVLKDLIHLQDESSVKKGLKKRVEESEEFIREAEEANKRYNANKIKQEEDAAKAAKVNDLNEENKRKEQEKAENTRNGVEQIVNTYNEGESFIIPEHLEHAGEEAIFTDAGSSKNNTRIKIKTKGGEEFIVDTLQVKKDVKDEQDSSTEGSDIEDSNDYSETIEAQRRVKPDDKGRAHVRILSTKDSGTLLTGIHENWLSSFERVPVSKLTQALGFGIGDIDDVNKMPEGAKKAKVLKALDIFNRFNKLTKEEKEKQIEFLYEYLPIKAIAPNGVYSYLTTLPTVTDNNENIDSIQAWNNTEVLVRKQIINHVLLHGGNIETLSSQIEFQYPGTLELDSKKDGKVPENKITDLNGIKDISDIKLMVVNQHGNLILPDGTFTPFSINAKWAGAIFMEVRRANGTIFNLKLNIKKLNKVKAASLYEILTSVLLSEGVTMNDSIDKLPPTVLSEILTSLSSELKLFNTTTKNIKIKQLLDLLIWQSKSSTARVLIEDSSLIFGEHIIHKDALGEETKKEFINFITQNKRHHIKFKRRKGESANALVVTNADYLQYLVDEQILNTNAVTNQPLFTGFTYIYINKKIDGAVPGKAEEQDNTKIKHYNTIDEMVNGLISQSKQTIRKNDDPDDPLVMWTADAFDGLGNKNRMPSDTVSYKSTDFLTSYTKDKEKAKKELEEEIESFYKGEFKQDVLVQIKKYKEVFAPIAKKTTKKKVAPIERENIQGTVENKNKKEAITKAKKKNLSKKDKRALAAKEIEEARKKAEELDENCK